ncbi:class A beta-lactamase [Roseomonas nepalensis]|uniref:Beta-lactamase n=1 Tax=Muricoccus nepalensis TaxID=1854500 RepID=A0A502FRP4_9PROT|nr:class A beta-lactamase [Roseomonas nepalensis]TPG51826.1 class A beta-lactamase [Roseomonas nepalensis]
MLQRRGLLGGAVLAAAGVAAGPAPGAAGGFEAAVRAAEREAGGRLGVAVLDTGTGARAAWRGGERFPVASTFKLLLAAAVLQRVEAGREGLDRRVPIAAADLVDHAPVTGRRVGPEGMSVRELLEATMVWSDNPAANLLLPSVGGPEGLTRAARGWGDEGFRLDRWETALGEGRPGDPRDTTTPAAMLLSLERLLVGEVLSGPMRDLLVGWMVGSRTGDAKIRAGLPPGWACGDKTGAAGHGTSNDVAVVWPPGRAPVLVAAYLTESPAAPAGRDAALAAVGRAVAAGF